jgi:hypothetical protein
MAKSAVGECKAWQRDVEDAADTSYKSRTGDYSQTIMHFPNELRGLRVLPVLNVLNGLASARRTRGGDRIGIG